MSTTARLARERARLLVLTILALTATLAVAGSAHAAAMEITDFSTTFQTPAGDPVTQAGAHADMVTDIRFSASRIDPDTGFSVPDEPIRDLDVNLPAGFYGNPQAVPTCSIAELVSTVGYCAPDAQVGVLTIFPVSNPASTATFPVYNVKATPGSTATLVSDVLSSLVRIEITVRTDGDFGLRAQIKNISEGLALHATRLTIWGVPSDPAHTPQRFTPGGPSASGAPRAAFATMPARCETFSSSVRARSWENPDRWVTKTYDGPAMTGCDALEFHPTIRVRPQVTKADTPSGYDVDLGVPQETAATGVGTPQLRKAVVTLPDGVAISPASAQGLEACSDAQLGLGSTGDTACPDASKIGTVSIDTPLLAEPLEGEIVLGAPRPGELFRLNLIARGPGLVLKIPGVAKPDPATGQLTATFDNAPQLPFTNLHLHFKGGSRAPLANPQSCGTKTTTTDMTSWAGSSSAPSDAFDVTGCTGAFAPAFEAGTVSPMAGAFSAFTMTIRRNDGDQELSGISVALPPGLLGILAGIPQCPEAAAAAGMCDASTRLGSVTVESGSGDQPLPLTGNVYLGGAYKGSPYSLAIVVRAVAGPFDLGTVVVRAPLNIDASGGKVAVPADALPTILEGVPLRLKTINVTLDRSGFMFNATNCTPMTVGATLRSVNGTTVSPTSRYQALGCGDLALNPLFAIRLSGAKDMKKNGHPGIVADLAQTPGQAGLKQVAVPLPAGVSVDIKNTGSACKAEAAAARTCPDAAIVGKASVKTPALPGELTGPVYFVENKANGKAGLPKLWLKLSGGGVPLDLYADTTIVGGRIVSTFVNIPDAPISAFHIEINGGAKGILKTGRDQCSASRTSKTVFEGQNGKVVRRTVRFGTDCAPRIAKVKASKTAVRLTVTGIGAGKLAVSGSGVRKRSTSVKSDIAAISANLSAGAKRTLARTGRVRLRLAVTYTPTGGKAKTLRKTVIVKRSR